MPVRMALSAAAVQTAAEIACVLAGKVLKALQAVAKAHSQRQRELQLLILLQGKLQDRWAYLKLNADSLGQLPFLWEICRRDRALFSPFCFHLMRNGALFGHVKECISSSLQHLQGTDQFTLENIGRD